MSGQPGTPARNNQAVHATHSPPPNVHNSGNGRSSQPAHQLPAHKAKHTADKPKAAALPRPFKRPHSQAPAAMKTRTTRAKGVMEG